MIPNPTELAQHVSVTGWSWTTVGVALLNLLVGGALVAWIKQLPDRRKSASEDRASDFDRLRDDVREAKEEARKTREIVQKLENMVACMRPAISILSSEVRRLDPNGANNPALVQAQELMAMAAVGDFGVGMAMTGLATTKGVKE